MAALSMQGRQDVHGFIASFGGSHRYVLDYLTEEAFRQQPEKTCQFLVRTSILDRMCAPLCEAVTGVEDGQAMLETLERANVFVFPLDDERQWYRYHHLFAELLRVRLHQLQPDHFGYHKDAYLKQWHGRRRTPGRKRAERSSCAHSSASH